LLNGLFIGLLYALIAVGFVMIYKASDVINFAQGEFVMFAAYVVAACLQLYDWPLWAAILVGLAAMVLLGLLIELSVLRYLIGRPIVAMIMATIGMAAFLRGFAPLLWGIESKQLQLPLPEEPFFIGDLTLAPTQIFAALLALACIVAVGWLFVRSRIGVALRAIADDQQVAMAMGIDVKRYFALSWALAGVIALAGGIVWGNMLGVDIQLALVGLKVFPVVILGGLDSIQGAILGGLIVGTAESLAAGFVDPLVGGGTKDFTPYVLMIIVLMIKPFGLFGKETIERV
jgi:branched-chain amino acid transport system permease protein